MKCEECGTEMKRVLDHLYKCPHCGAENNVSPDFDEIGLSTKYRTVIANGNMDYVASPSGELLMFFPKERIHDAVSVAKILNEETKPLLETIDKMGHELDLAQRENAALKALIKDAMELCVARSKEDYWDTDGDDFMQVWDILNKGIKREDGE